MMFLVYSLVNIATHVIPPSIAYVDPPFKGSRGEEEGERYLESQLCRLYVAQWSVSVACIAGSSATGREAEKECRLSGLKRDFGKRAKGLSFHLFSHLLHLH